MCPATILPEPTDFIDWSKACAAVETIDSNPLDVKSVVACPAFKASKEMLTRLGEHSNIITCPAFFDEAPSKTNVSDAAPSKNNVSLIVGVSVGAVALLATLFGTFYFGRRVGAGSSVKNRVQNLTHKIKRKLSVNSFVSAGNTVAPVLSTAIPAYLFDIAIDPKFLVPYSALLFDLVPGSTDQFVVLGRGAFGVVLAAEFHDTKCAVKLIKGELVTEETVSRFKRELDLIAGLRHPSIVQCLGCCWEPPSNFALICELCERGSLDKFLKSQPSFAWRGSQAVSYKSRWALQIAQGVAHLHSLEPPIIHRDLKCGNVLIDHGMHAKLTDFGESRALSAKDVTMTEVGT